MMRKKEFEHLSVLYIDDEPFIRKNTVEFLSLYFNTVYEAKDAYEGLEVVQKHKPQIIITDIKMPRLNGIEFIKTLRKQDKETQIIIATAFTDTNYLIDAVGLNLVKYLVKPITEDMLIPVLRECAQNLNHSDKHVKKLSTSCFYNTLSQNLVCDGKTQKLSKNELIFMQLLCNHANQVIPYEQIEQNIWQDEGMSSDAIRSLVKALRKKLPKNTLENVPRLGYKISLCS